MLMDKIMGKNKDIQSMEIDHGRDLYTILEKDVLDALRNCRASEFPGMFEHALYYLYINGMLTYNTIRLITLRLSLNKKWTHLVKNPDNTVTCYIENKIWDTFLPEDVMEWIVRTIMADEKFAGVNEAGDFAGFKNTMEKEHFPYTWIRICNDIKKLEHPVFTKKHIYWLNKNHGGSYALMRVKYHPSLKSTVYLDDGEVFFDGVTSYLHYNENSGKLYCKIYGMDAYMTINDKDECEISYGAEVKRTSNASCEWFVDREAKLHMLYKGENTVFEENDENSFIKVRKDGTVFVAPWSRNAEMFFPYILSIDGTRKRCSEYEAEKYVWKRMLDDMWNFQNYDGVMNFTELVEREDAYKPPYPFTLEMVETKLLELKNRNLLLPELVQMSLELMHVFIKPKVGKNEEISENLINIWQRIRDEETEKKDTEEVMFERLLRISGEWGKIGNFTVKDGILRVNLDYVFDGSVVGNFIACKGEKEYDGRIYFDRCDKKYLVIWKGKKFEHMEELKKLTGVKEFVWLNAKEKLKPYWIEASHMVDEGKDILAISMMEQIDAKFT